MGAAVFTLCCSSATAVASAGQLAYPQLTAQALDSGTPIYGAILGAVADEVEVANILALSQPTRGTYVHMPAAARTDVIYDIWREQGDLVQLSYRSDLRENGSNELNVTFGSETVSSSFEINLRPPQVLLQQQSLQINRVGAVFDAALPDLQPATQPLIARIMWPDGRPRLLSAATLLVNGQPQVHLQTLPDQLSDTIKIDWDISSLDEGQFEVALAVTDEFGYQGTSAVIPAQITTERPNAPTVIPTPQPVDRNEALNKVPLIPWEGLPWLDEEIVAGVVAVLLLLLTLVFWRSRGQKAADKRLQDRIVAQAQVLKESDAEDDRYNLIPRLEPFVGSPTESVEFGGDNISIGRDGGLADIVIPHKSVASLHARIRHQEDGYWLFDEGSAEGTYLNYARLGLAPRLLQDGDVVQFGTVGYRFRLRPTGYGVESAAPDETAMDEVVIFDLDGLMVDTEPLSRLAWDQVLAELGCAPIDDAFYNRLIGHRIWETAEMLVARYALPMEPSELAWRKEILFAELRSAEMQVMPGLYDLLGALKQRDIRWGVATSTPRHVAEEILNKINVMGSCEALAAGDEVPNGKPHPDVYLLAAERLGKEPAQCMVFEDSTTGCKAARAASMMVVAIPNDQDRLENFTCADRIMTSLLDVPGHLDALLSEVRQR